MTPQRQENNMPKAKKVAKKSRRTAQKMLVLVGTRKGAWIYRGDSSRRSWRTDGPHFLGQCFNHLLLDPRDRRTLLAAVKTGHLGPTIFRSTDFGRHWQEAAKPPAFVKVESAGTGPAARAVDHTFWLTPGHASEPGVWYAGTSPQGLFRSSDAGVSWEPFSIINDDPEFRSWMGSEKDGTPDGPKLHSIIVDPRDPKHLYIGMSGGGFHESLDGGVSWSRLIEGMEVFEGMDKAVPSFHDPHCVRLCPTNPDRLYQQNHCGIYRLDRPSRTWQRIGVNMPKKIGDIGFPIEVHPRNDNTAWVFPMDGTMVWPRTSPDGAPAAFVTRNGGKTWQRQANGLPDKQAWWTVKRQAMATDTCDPVGVYFGTTSGELWFSRDEGKRWLPLAARLPEIYSVETAIID
jgi:hypothetical protein